MNEYYIGIKKEEIEKWQEENNEILNIGDYFFNKNKEDIKYLKLVKKTNDMYIFDEIHIKDDFTFIKVEKYRLKGGK